MKLGKIFLGLALSFLLTACSATKGNEITNNLTTSFSNTTTTIEKNVYINNFSSDIKTTGVVNPCMGFYRTRYLNLIRSGVEVYDDFEENGFYHLRVDISDFSSATNNEADYEITDDALQKLETYLYYANNKRCSIIIRFAYDEYKGKENMEPSIPMMVKHIEKLSSVINQYKDLELFEDIHLLKFLNKVSAQISSCLITSSYHFSNIFFKAMKALAPRANSSLSK